LLLYIFFTFACPLATLCKSVLIHEDMDFRIRCRQFDALATNRPRTLAIFIHRSLRARGVILSPPQSMNITAITCAPSLW